MKIVENEYYRIIVCGGRHFNEFQVVDSVVNRLVENLGFDYSQVEIVSGHCDGADKLGEKFAEVYNTHLKVFPANWAQYGRAAGPIRNKAMIDYINKAEHKTVVAFVSKNSKGTKNTVELAKKLNIPVIEIEYDIFESNSTLYEGVSYSDGTFSFNWDSDNKDDIISLTGTCIHLTKFNKKLRYYGYKINKTTSTESYKSFLKFVKTNAGNDANINEMIDKCVEDFYEKSEIKNFDYILKVPSKSNINILLCNEIIEKFDNCSIIPLTKLPATELDFDWDKFKKSFKGDYYDKIVKYLEAMIETLRKQEQFSITKISPKYRKFIKPMISFGGYEISNHPGCNLLIVDDTFTTGSTLNMIIDKLDTIGFTGKITVLTLINN